MKIEAITGSPKELVAAIDKLMNEGELKTWKIVKDANNQIMYTHTPEQWNEKALITRESKADRVLFGITYWDGKPAPSIELKGYYLGRFTEILLVHLRSQFAKLEVSA